MGTSLFSGGKAPAPSKSSLPTSLFSTSPEPDQLEQSVRLGATQTPEVASRALLAQRKTSLPLDVVSRNLESVEQTQKAREFNLQKFGTEHPTTSAWMAENPTNAAAVSDDLQALGGVERTIRALTRGIQSGRAQGERGRLGYDVLGGETLDARQQARLKQLEEELANEPAGLDWWTTGVYRSSEIVGQMFSAAPDALASGIAGATAGAAAGALGGPLGSGALATAGFAIGLGSGFATHSFKVEGGFSYLELGNVRGDEGQGIDEVTRKAVAFGVGALNGLLESAGVAMIAAPYRTVAKKLFRESARDALVRPTMRAALGDFAKSYSVAVGGEVATEVMQETSNIFGEELAKMGSAGEFQTLLNSPEEREKAIARLGSIVLQTAQGMALLALPGASIHGATTAYQARKAQQSADYFTALGEGVQGSKTFERLPEEMQALVARATKDGPLETVYAPVETWDTYWQSQNVDPAMMAEELGVRDAYDVASASGGDIAIPTARYATKIAATEHNAYFANELRTSPLAMNGREAKVMLDEAQLAMEQEVVAPEEQQATKQATVIGDAIVEQLMATGKYDETTARTYASTLYENVYKNLAARTGMTPAQMFERFPVTVRAREGPDKAPRPTTDVPGFVSPKYRKATEAALVARLAELYDRIEVESTAHAKGVSGFSRMVDNGAQGNATGTVYTFRAMRAAGQLKVAGRLVEEVRAELEARGVAPESIDSKLEGLREDRIERDAIVNVDEGAADDFDFSFTQRKANKPRGAIGIQKGADGRPVGFVIDLFKDSDLSTLLHESAHLYLEILSALASDPNASLDVTTDFGVIRSWLGAADGAAFSVDQHEKFARGFEAYLMEGEAPSPALRRAFASFKAWLLQVYRSLTALNVSVPDDVRAVFDRLLASDEAIAAAEAEQAMDPLFADPEAIGMTDGQAAVYRARILDALAAGRDKVALKLMDQVRREQTQVYKDERARVRAEVGAELNEGRDMAALAFLSKGTLPDGSALPEGATPFKLSRSALFEEYASQHPNLLKRLRRLGVYGKEGGMHPDEAAEFFGFASGDELIQMLLAQNETHTQKIERLTDERIEQDDPRLLSPAELPIEAMKAVHSERRADVLHAELEHLLSENLATFKGLARRIARRLPVVAAVRAEAERIIAAIPVGKINVLLYQRGEQRAAKLAVEKLLAGDIEGAFDEKQRELLNHELYRAAQAAKEETDSIVTYAKRFTATAKRVKLGKAGHTYLEQIDALLERYDLARGLSNKDVARRQSLRAWYDDQVAQGREPIIPEAVLDQAQKISYKELPLSDLRDLQTALKSIDHLARTKNNLLASARARELEDARTEIIGAIGANHSLTVEPQGHAPETIATKLVKGTRRLFAEHSRMEFLFDFLDGYVGGNGVVWQYLFKPFAHAETVENDLRRESAAAMLNIFAPYTKAERAAWYSKRIYIAGAKTEKHDGNFTKSAILAVALNQGNEYNKQALMDGYLWTPQQIAAILDHLDQRDWTLVQGIWDHVNSFWPLVEQMEKDLNGIAPDKVLATPVQTKHGIFAGGYYPILFDRERSVRQTALDEKSSVKEMFGGNWARAMTRHGHTIERTNTGGKPISLLLSGLSDHLNQVVHDLAFRRAVVDVHRLVSDEQITVAIEAAAGRDMYLQLKPWLHAIAGDRAREFSGPTEKLLGKARAGATVVGLGLKFTSALMQTLGYTLTVNELGPKYAMAGLRAAFGNPRRIKRQYQFATERSAMMRDRLENYDRDVRDYVRERPALEGMEAAWFVMVGHMDLAMSLPTWLGAYRKAMDGKLETIRGGDELAAVDYADKTVRMTQAAGAAKDIAAIQRGGDAWKLFTMFYSSMSILFNQFSRAGGRYAVDKNVPALLGSLALVWFAPVVMEAALRGNKPDEDDGWAKYLARKAAAYPFGTVVLARDVANALLRRAETGIVDASGSPAGEVLEASTKAAYALLVKPFSDDEDVTRGDWKSIVNTVGYAAKLPTAQVWKTGEYFTDWWTGEEDPANPVEGVYRALITGKPRN